MVFYTKGIAWSARDDEFHDGMAYLYCVEVGSRHCFSLCRFPDDPLIEVMVIDQMNHKTTEVAAELYPDRLVVRLSGSAPGHLAGISEYEIRITANPEEIQEVEPALEAIFRGVGRYERRF